MKSIKLYGISNCNTVKKAMDYLKGNNLNYEFHDFKKKGVSSELLQSWMSEFGWEKVVNKQGLTFKKLSAEEKLKVNDVSTTEAYLINNTSAIKRPVLEIEGKPVSIGFEESKYTDIFNKEF